MATPSHIRRSCASLFFFHGRNGRKFCGHSERHVGKRYKYPPRLPRLPQQPQHNPVVSTCLLYSVSNAQIPAPYHISHTEAPSVPLNAGRRTCTSRQSHSRLAPTLTDSRVFFFRPCWIHRRPGSTLHILPTHTQKKPANRCSSGWRNH